ncbi:MAG: MoxR family ATPase [Chloroflexi bacterium]|nr:MoxR family ATPase [Chloroflexota bacterium]
MTTINDLRAITLEKFLTLARSIEEEVSKVIVGQRELIRHTLIALLSGGNVLLEGVPGLGKTMLVRTLAQALDCTFSRVQFTPDLMPADIVGTMILVEDESGNRMFRFEAGPVFANLLLADEINRATPKTQSALLEAMQEHSVTVSKTTHKLSEPFFVLATQNPIEMEGTFPLPEAQLDRFFFKLNVAFPSCEELVEIANRTTGEGLPQARPVASGSDVIAMQALARGVPVPEHITSYAAQLVRVTHPDDDNAPVLVRRYVRYGSSPRGMQTLILGGKVNALLDGRASLAAEDLREMAAPALRHRLLLNFEAQAEGLTPDSIIQEVLGKTKIVS